jgi:hypothetical protein
MENSKMMKSLCITAMAAAALFAASSAEAACSRVHTKGTAGDKAGAMVQAWEMQLQARGWKGWPTFMATGMKVGNAPGYKSAKIERQKCTPGEAGVVCRITANLCD